MTLKIKGINKSFENSGKSTKVLEDINLEIQKGEFVTLLGPSGCGKTTLLTIVAGFKKPCSGEVFLGNKKVEKPGPDRGFMFQDYALFPWMTIKDNILYPMKLQKIGKKKMEEKLDWLLDIAHLKGKENHFPYEISGGMKQRTAFVRALAGDPEILLMDEPLGAIDFQMRNEIQKEFEAVWLKTKKTVLMVTHDIDEALYLSDRIIVMSRNKGEIIDEIKVTIPRSRDKNLPEYITLKTELTLLLERALKG